MPFSRSIVRMPSMISWLMLLADGVDTISLNVRADNDAAIRAYEKLGFAHATDYVEVVLTSRMMDEAPSP